MGRLEDDFADAKVFRTFGFFPPGAEHYTNELGLHVLERGAAPQGILDAGVVLGNIQQLYQTHITGKRNLAEMDEEFDKIERGLTATQWVTDAEPMRKQLAIALERLGEQQRRAEAPAGGNYQPILFIVAICIKDARAAHEMLKEEKAKGGCGINSLLVTEESDDEERIMAGVIGKRGKALEEATAGLERKLGNRDAPSGWRRRRRR